MRAGIEPVGAIASCRLVRDANIHPETREVGWSHPFGPMASNEEKAHSVKSKQTLRRCDGHRVDRGLFQIYSEDPDRLCGVHQKEDAAIAAESADPVYVSSESWRKTDAGHRQQLGIFVYRFKQYLRIYDAIHAPNRANLNAKRVSNIVPREYIARMLDLSAQNYVVARFPGECSSDGVN